MKAIVYRRYGPPEVLQLGEIPTPLPGPGDVLVRVQAAALNAGDLHCMRGEPFAIRLMMSGFPNPKLRALGSDMAGQVEAVGTQVGQFEPGDEVFGTVSTFGFSAFAEYVCAPESAFVRKPSSVTFEQAAAVPTAGLTALQTLRDDAGLQRGQSVLVNGASGGVGTFAVQIAKSMGATVTAVCSTRNVAMVKAIGADHVVDYTQVDPTESPERYDVVLDAAAYRSATTYRRILRRGGVYVLVGGSSSRFFQAMLTGPWMSPFGMRVRLASVKPNPRDLAVLRDLLDTGMVTPVIDRRFSFDQTPDAVRYLEDQHARGKVVISMSRGVA
jgi:NADPH:quinone reductase-like Zn-dependent oxidoreductase